MTNPNDNCTCGHSAASHGFGYEDSCTAGHAQADPRPACPCVAFSLASVGEELTRDVDLDGVDRPVRVPPGFIRALTSTDSLDGFWLAYEDQGPGLIGAQGVFPDELSALRFAVENGLRVKHQGWGAFK